ncbi:MAG: hypothetical protein AAGA75_24925 [Cyanobacteria bacterium P01_E01_bin.6]
MRINLGTETLTVLLSGEQPTILTLEYQKVDSLSIPSAEGIALLPGPAIKINCESKEIFNKLFNQHHEWIIGLGDFRYVAFYIENQFRACEPLIGSYMGATMQNLPGDKSGSEQDIFTQLSEITSATGQMFSVVDMMDDTLLWTSKFINPFGDVPYKIWQRRNHQGHIPDELGSYKRALFQNGNQLKIPVEMIDFNRPHLNDFQYNAFLLPEDFNADPETVIQVTVDAWAGVLSDGTQVRISTHTRPIIVVP